MAQTSTSSYIDETPTSGDYLGVAGVNIEKTAAEKATVATTLSDSGSGIVARVITWTGDVLKVKWFKGGLVLGSYKSKKYNQDRALTSLEYLKTNKLASSAVATMAVTGTATGSAAGGATSQLVATVTRADASTSVVTSQATWASATPAAATVSSTGLVTAVAVGTSVITATYGGVSNTLTYTTTT